MSLKYLGHIVTSLDDTWPELVGNLHNVSKRWVRLLIILKMERANPRLSGMLFKSTVQSVLIFESEMWVMTPRMGHAIGGF